MRKYKGNLKKQNVFNEDSTIKNKVRSQHNFRECDYMQYFVRKLK